VKRLVFSIYTENIDEHTSVSSFKRRQFSKHKDDLLERQKQYAFDCNADYELFDTSETNYDQIQFSKLLKLEEMSDLYDEVLYLDFDVVPITKTSIFDKFNLDSLCIYSIPVSLPREVMQWRNENDEWHTMDMYSKMCAKNAMLLLHDINGKQECFNTGVVALNKRSAELLNFTHNLNFCHEVFEEACLDNLYPKEMNRSWRPNNEVYSSFLVEYNNVPVTNIGLQWNFIVDHTYPEASAASHMIHYVNKEFTFQTQ